MVGEDVSGPETDDAMTRSEEELRVGKTERESGRARLRKYVVDEEVTQTVPVRREEVRVEREPITDANAGDALDGPAISEEEHEVVLHDEELVVDKRAVPKERVRLDKDTVTDEQQVSEDVRKEQVELIDAEASPPRASTASAAPTKAQPLANRQGRRSCDPSTDTRNDHMSLFAAVEVGDSLQQALDSFFGFLPNLLGFLVILVIGYIIARVVKGILTKVLTKVGLDKALTRGRPVNTSRRCLPAPARRSSSARSRSGSCSSAPVLARRLGAEDPSADDVRFRDLRLPAERDRCGVIFVVAGAIAGAVAALVARRWETPRPASSSPSSRRC